LLAVGTAVCRRGVGSLAGTAFLWPMVIVATFAPELPAVRRRRAMCPGGWRPPRPACVPGRTAARGENPPTALFGRRHCPTLFAVAVMILSWIPGVSARCREQVP